MDNKEAGYYRVFSNNCIKSIRFLLGSYQYYTLLVLILCTSKRVEAVLPYRNKHVVGLIKYTNQVLSIRGSQRILYFVTIARIRFSMDCVILMHRGKPPLSLQAIGGCIVSNYMSRIQTWLI